MQGLRIQPTADAASCPKDQDPKYKDHLPPGNIPSAAERTGLSKVQACLPTSVSVGSARKKGRATAF